MRGMYLALVALALVASPARGRALQESTDLTGWYENLPGCLAAVPPTEVSANPTISGSSW